MSFLKQFTGPLGVLGWLHLGPDDIMKDGDVLVFLRFNQAGLFAVTHPASINASSWHREDGCILSGYTGEKTSALSESYMPSRLEGCQYSVFRRIGKGRLNREYKPSKWADPVPLP